jgi:hypothetical protein
MSAPALHVNAPQAGPSAVRGLRLRLKPAHQSPGFVQGAWWPRSTQLTTELPALMAAVSLRLSNIDRVIYDENGWAPTLSGIEVSGNAVTLHGSADEPANTLSVISEQLGKLVLLVVPPYTNPTRAYRAVMTAANPDDASTADELLGIGAREAEDRRIALIAQQRWETDGGTLHPRHQRSGPATPARRREVRGAH